MKLKVWNEPSNDHTARAPLLPIYGPTQTLKSLNSVAVNFPTCGATDTAFVCNTSGPPLSIPAAATASPGAAAAVSQAVDFWSLGVTVFKLLTGSRPFDRRRFQAFVDDTRCRMGLDQSKYKVS